MSLPRLVGITPGDGRPVGPLIAAALAGGADAVVVREHTLPGDLPPGAILHGRTPGAIARAISTGRGLHLPASVDPGPLRGRISGTLSQSCHSLQALHRAGAAGCDFAFLSPIFSPRSKPDDRRPPLTLAGLAAICAQSPLPVLALGGIGLEEIPGCLAAGAWGVAAISGVFPPGGGARRVAEAAAAMRQACGRRPGVG